MTKPYKPLDLGKLKTQPLSQRKSKVSVDHFARTWKKGGSFAEFMDRLPGILAAEQVRLVVKAICQAYARKRPVILGLGAHVIKVGLSPIIIDLMQRGIISALATNGAGIIHDTELALCGATSEDVAATLGDGTFGMARETGAFLNSAVKQAKAKSCGLGQAVGQAILDQKPPFGEKSLMAAAARLKIPCTVHVALGTDILHMHPGFDPEATGGASHRDFRLFAAVVADLEGGVYLNVGSAVILPEIFLKAVALARNLGHALEEITTVNMDFISHYRPMTNVVCRPTAKGGQGFNLIGHHEIMLPLIAAAVIEQIDPRP